MQTERRRSPRMTVEGIGFVTLSLRNSFELMGTLEGLSRNGILLSMLPTCPEAEPAPGDAVTLAEMPRAWRTSSTATRAMWSGPTAHTAASAWIRPWKSRDAALKRALRDNHLLPWSQWPS
jgi:hypothetical protein